MNTRETISYKKRKKHGHVDYMQHHRIFKECIPI